MPSTFVELNFPSGGIDQSQAFSKQQPRPVLDNVYVRTTPDAVNVRGYDPASDRLRGASRPMLARPILNPAVAGWMVQDLNVIVGTGYENPSAGPSDIDLIYDTVAVLYSGDDIAFGEST